MQTLSPESRSDTLYRTLQRDILHFNLLPGELLSENTIAARTQTTRATVREAIARLEAEHCVEVYPQRGTQVSLISPGLVRQAVFLRATLEQDVLSTLCRQGPTEAQQSELDASLQRQRALLAEQRSVELLDEDIRMHRLFFEYCGRGRAWDALTAINCDLLRVSFLQIETYSYRQHMAPVPGWANLLTEHRLMLDALQRRDPEVLCFTAQQHITRIEREADHLRRIYPQYFTDEVTDVVPAYLAR